MMKYIQAFVDAAIVGFVIWKMGGPDYVIFLGAWLAGDTSFILSFVRNK